MAKRPLVDVNLTTEFGEILESEAFQADGVAHHDFTYTPGFSEMKVDRDGDIQRHARHEIKASEVRVLPVNLRWWRTVKGSGSDPDQMRVARARNLGYRAVTEADIGQPWLTEMPPGAMLAADGTIKTAAGDNVLMVADQQTAARNAMRKKRLTEEMVDGIQYTDEGLGKVGERAEAFVTRETGPAIGGTK